MSLWKNILRAWHILVQYKSPDESKIQIRTLPNSEFQGPNLAVSRTFTADFYLNADS